ncbi:MAG TPA: DNA polymerase III subunit [Polyangiaceae bacterium]|nr:DNA polymerase III subunit [Polyangiaceae bacterium]
MPLSTVLGQSGAIGTLERALRTGKVHHAYRFEGPNGVGKETTAFALAQALLCDTPPPDGEAHHACGRCSACHRAITLSTEPPQVPLHPDVVLIERGLYSPEALRRARPELQDISVDQIRKCVLERASFPPHEGRARVIIVRRAHELSTSAANALLKTLEEPPARTYFVLLTDRGSDLLDTVRSRTQLLRFAPLPASLVQSLLEKRGLAADVAKTAADLAGGSVAAALTHADPSAAAERHAFIEGTMTALAGSDLAAAIALSETRARDKDVLYDRLSALATHFAQEGRAEAKAHPDRALRAAERYGNVARAIDELERNGSPALVLEAMVARLRHGL